MIIRAIQGASAVVATALVLGGCSLFDTRSCEDIRAEEYQALESVWPNSVPFDRFDYGACDDSGDRAIAYSAKPSTAAEFERARSALEGDGWVLQKDGGDAMYTIWTRDQGGRHFTAWLGDDAPERVLQIELD